ncbi:MAG: T9SS type A sorting domain-containing protein, partial [Flavobacteriales bacterium]|nr:T9SS type A sorting domain-containing protein [Flavobacteriales bacterium]
PPQLQVDAGDDLPYVPGLTLQVAATGGTGTYSYLWSPTQYLDDPTSPTPMVQGLMSTTLFTVQVTDAVMGCTLTDEVLVDYNIGMSELGSGAIAVYPNPSDGLVRIQGPVAVQRVQLRAPNGALAIEHSGAALHDLVMDVSSLPAGVYFMTIEFIDGRSHTHKLCATSVH